MLSHVWFLPTLWTVACQAPLSMGFSRQEYWSGGWLWLLTVRRARMRKWYSSVTWRGSELLRPHWGGIMNMCYMLSHFSHVQFSATLWTVALQAPLSTRFSMQEHWSGCHALIIYEYGYGLISKTNSVKGKTAKHYVQYHLCKVKINSHSHKRDAHQTKDRGESWDGGEKDEAGGGGCGRNC